MKGLIADISHLTPSDFTAPDVTAVVQKRALAVGVVGAAVSIVFAIVNYHTFLRGYLIGFMMWLGITLGCLALLMMQYMTGGVWGFVIRRQLQAASRLVWIMALLFIPILISVWSGDHSIFEWAKPSIVSHDPRIQHKLAYLSPKWFTLRAVFYFLAWALLGRMLTRLSEARDDAPGNDIAWRRRFEKLAAPGLVLYAFTITFASIDWVMSLDPHWGSTIYGMLFICGQGLSAFAFVIAVTVLLAQHEPFSEVVRPDHLLDLGKLMLAFVMLWAYCSFSQWLIIWSGNLPEEITWYVHRLGAGWEYVGVVLIAFHFALPFLLLLSRDLKRNGRLIAGVAIFIIAMRFVDLYWLIEPNFVKEQFYIGPMDFIAPIAIGGIWVAAFFWQLRSRPLLPLNDPLFHAFMGRENV